MSELAQIDDNKSKDNRDTNINVNLELVTSRDVRAALACVKPSASSKHCARYTAWSQEYGSGYSVKNLDDTIDDSIDEEVDDFSMAVPESEELKRLPSAIASNRR